MLKKNLLIGIAALVVGYWLGRPSAEERDAAEERKSAPLNEKEVCADLIARYNKLSEQYVAMQESHQVAESSAAASMPASASASACPDASGVPAKSGDDAPKESVAGADAEGSEFKPDDFPAGDRGEAPTEGDRVVQVSGEQLTKDFARFDTDAQKANNGLKKRSFLNRIVLGDPHGTIDRMKEVSEKDKWLQKMMGVWRGSIIYTKKSRPSGYIRLEIRTPENPPWQWAVRVDLHEKKGVADRKMGGTELLHTVSDASKAYFVRSSETSYLQFYFQPEANSLLGNYYERAKDGSYSRSGTYTLRRAED